MQQTAAGKRRTSHGSSGFLSFLERVEPWVPWIIGAVYFAVMAYLTFRYHRIGGLGVETDFYVELVPQAKKLLAGEFSPLSYGAKGPVYSFLLAGLYLFVRDYFYAGLLLNLLSGFVFLVALHYLLKDVFNSLTAVIVTTAVLFNYIFQSYTYQAGSDIPFMALCALSMLFLFREGGIKMLVLSAVFGALAFLTRYNGAFIILGSIIFITVGKGAWRERLKRAGLWLVIFIIVGLPWYIPNTIATGSPVHNENYINVMMEFYAINNEGVSYESWTDALPKEFTGMGDIFFYDPVFFLTHMTVNAGKHFVADMKDLTGWRFGFLIIPGLIAFLFSRPKRREMVYYFFGLVYFGILTLVFYNARFSLFLLVFYLPLAVWPCTFPRIKKSLGKLHRMPVVIICCVVFSYAVTTSRATLSEIKNTPPYLEHLKDLGLTLEKQEPDKAKIIIGRKPHVAYFAGLEASMFPEKPRSIAELVAYCHDNGVAYILYSGIEAGSRPYVRDLLQVNTSHPGLTLVYYNPFGAIYRVDGS